MAIAVRKQYETLCGVQQAVDMFKKGIMDIVVMASEYDGAVGSDDNLVTLVRADGQEIAFINRKSYPLTAETIGMITAMVDLTVYTAGIHHIDA